MSKVFDEDRVKVTVEVPMSVSTILGVSAYPLSGDPILEKSYARSVL